MPMIMLNNGKSIQLIRADMNFRDQVQALVDQGWLSQEDADKYLYPQGPIPTPHKTNRGKP